MTTVDLNNIGYKGEPFVLAKDVTQVFYVKDMSTKPKREKNDNSSAASKEVHNSSAEVSNAFAASKVCTASKVVSNASPASKEASP